MLFFFVQGVSEIWDPKVSLMTQHGNDKFKKNKRRYAPETIGFYILWLYSWYFSGIQVLTRWNAYHISIKIDQKCFGPSNNSPSLPYHFIIYAGKKHSDSSTMLRCELENLAAPPVKRRFQERSKLLQLIQTSPFVPTTGCKF